MRLGSKAGGLGLGLLALLLLLLRTGGDSRTPAPGSALGPGEVPRLHTGNVDEHGDDKFSLGVAGWFGARFGLALEVLAPNVPNPLLRPIALSVVAQWAHETNRGKSEFNFNLGGWRARKRDPYFLARDVLTGKELFRWTAYPDLPRAVADQLQRLHDTFPSAWSKLLATPNTSAWIEELGRKGYYVAPPGTSQAQHIQNYARAWAMQRAELGRLAA